MLAFFKKSGIRAFMLFDLYWLYALIIAFNLKKIENKLESVENPLRILALNASRFRGDLEDLAQTGKVVVYKISFPDQTRLMGYFYSSIGDLNILHLGHAGSYGLEERQTAYQNFLVKTLSCLRCWFGIQICMSTNCSYAQDFDWGNAAQAAGMKYIVLLRGGLVTCEGIRRDLLKRFSEYAPFKGDLIIVHNSEIASVLVQSGFVSENKIKVLGASRMQRFVQKIENAMPKTNAHQKTVSLFSFPHSSGLFAQGMFSAAYKQKFDGVWAKGEDRGFIKLFHSVHKAFIQIARQHPEIRVVIKTKWDEDWIDRIEKIAIGEGMDPRSFPNLEIVCNKDPHDLILESDIICSFGSTTVLEAALARKPVILPLYEEALNPVYCDYVSYSDMRNLFDVADSEQALKNIIEDRLQNTNIEDHVQELREQAFMRYVSIIKQPVVDNIIQEIGNLT